jgi:threonine/homoserine/homoserine lactone efflux protein
MFALLASKSLGAHALSVRHALSTVQTRLCALLTHTINPSESIFAYTLAFHFVTVSMDFTTAHLTVLVCGTSCCLAVFTTPAVLASAFSSIAASSATAG